MTWFSQAQTREQLIEQAPFLKQQFQDFYSSFWQLPYIPAQTLELCRLRLAQLHQSETEFKRVEVELAASLRDNLSQWSKSDSFDDAQKAALAFAEVYAMDPQAITDVLADDVKAHYGDAGLVALIEALGLFYGLTRVSQLWDL